MINRRGSVRTQRQEGNSRQGNRQERIANAPRRNGGESGVRPGESVIRGTRQDNPVDGTYSLSIGDTSVFNKGTAPGAGPTPDAQAAINASWAGMRAQNRAAQIQNRRNTANNNRGNRGNRGESTGNTSNSNSPYDSRFHNTFNAGSRRNNFGDNGNHSSGYSNGYSDDRSSSYNNGYGSDHSGGAYNRRTDVRRDANSEAPSQSMRRRSWDR